MLNAQLDLAPMQRSKVVVPEWLVDRREAMSINVQQELEALGRDLLKTYSRAIELRQLEVAGQLLQALEELASSEPGCVDILNQAHLQIAHLRNQEDEGRGR